ncbi:MAG: magnesium transporter CorA family protein [Gordonibacter sp.]
MIEYFCTDGQQALRKLDAEASGCWIAVFEPTSEELTWLRERFGFEEEDACAALDLEEVSRIEYNHGYTLSILDTPVRDRSSNERSYKTIPIALFETQSNVVTVCSVYKIPLIDQLKSSKNLPPTAEVGAFASEVLIASSAAYFMALRVINRRRAELMNMVKRPSRKELEDLYVLDSSLVYLKTSLVTNDAIFDKHLRRFAFATDEARERFDDVTIENRQALETTRIYSEILDSTIEHFSLLMEHDLNRTMQVVATVTLVLCVPTAVAGFFGMNVLGIPLAEIPWGFGIVTCCTVLASVVLLLVLKKLRWF